MFEQTTPREQQGAPLEPVGSVGGDAGIPNRSNRAARDLTVGELIAQREVLLTRDALVRYAGASGDFNPIHYRDDFAESVGLPGVIAHGMLTMGVAVQDVAVWAGSSAAIADYQVKFTRPVPVPAASEARVLVSATVAAVWPERAEVRIDLTVTVDDATVLGKAQVVVRCR